MKRDIQHKDSIMALNRECCYAESREQAHYAECHYAECHYAECRGAISTAEVSNPMERHELDFLSLRLIEEYFVSVGVA
jgi:hypothetical protein